MHLNGFGVGTMSKMSSDGMRKSTLWLRQWWSGPHTHHKVPVFYYVFFVPALCVCCCNAMMRNVFLVLDINFAPFAVLSQFCPQFSSNFFVAFLSSLIYSLFA